MHRLRRRPLAICLTDQFNETLEKTLLKCKQNFKNDHNKLIALRNGTFDEATTKEKLLETVIGKNIAEHGGLLPIMFSKVIEKSISVTTRALEVFNNIMNVKYKGPILNALIRIQPNDRMTRKAFEILTLPEYGGVSPQCVALLCDLVRVYREKAVPKEFKQRIDKLSVPDFMVGCFYFNMVSLLERISFVPLDADTVRRTDAAMITRRHQLFPGQDIPDNIYDISIALCCEKVCTLMGYGIFFLLSN